MNKHDPKIFLLNLLDDNQEKISYVAETKCSKELFGIYQALQNDLEIDNKTDHSNIHDHKVKEKILQHPALTNYHKYKIANTEANKSLKKIAFNGYFKSQWVFNPLFLYRVWKYKQSLNETSSRITIFLSIWQGLLFSTISSLIFTNLWFLPLVFMAATTLSWYVILQAPRKMVSEFLEMTGLGIFMMVMIPLIIPIAFCLGFGVFLMVGFEQVADRADPKKPYSSDDDDYPMSHHYHSGRWGRDY